MPRQTMAFLPLEVKSHVVLRRQLSMINCQWGQLSVGTTVRGPTVRGNCQNFSGTGTTVSGRTTVRPYSFEADNCQILVF